MPTFVTLPRIVQAERVAVLIQAARQNVNDLPVWFKEHFDRGGVHILDAAIECHTADGRIVADRSDWIACHESGGGELAAYGPEEFSRLFGRYLDTTERRS